MKENETGTFYPSDRQQWRQWLQENHDKQQSVWLVYYRVKSGIPTISWGEAVDEALCFGWIDSTKKTIDDEQFIQFFSRRKATSTWSKVNKEKVQRLIAEGSMTAMGLQSIETAKQNGSWTILDTVEELIIPDDLELAFDARPGSKDFFLSLSKSARKIMLAWLVLAKREETRQKRIAGLVDSAAQKLKPQQFR